MSPDDLLNVVSIQVPAESVRSTIEHLRTCGRHGLEGVAFWAGRLVDRIFMVSETVVPRQHALLDMQSGVCVAIDGDELFRLNVWLHKAGLQFIAQIHSHPGSAYHSPTDDDMSVVTRAGALSIVVPDFASGGLEISRSAVHRLDRDGDWRLLSTEESTRLLKIEDS